MYNYFMLIGFVCKEIEVKEVADGKRVAKLNLAVTRPFPNVDGTRGTDYFNIALWEFLANQASDYLKVGSKVAIKGRIAPKYVTLDTGAKIQVCELVGEKLLNVTDKPDFSDNTESTEDNTTEEN